ncbi:helicase SRCAP isoform 4-T4 [Pangshura tecta]
MQRNKRPWKPDKEDEEFTANEEEAEDEEETIDAEEKLEGDMDHRKELDDLAQEGELPVEELLQRYAGAYASDFEMDESDSSSDASEPSTSEYEEESEDEDSSSQSDSTAEEDSEEEEEESEEEEEDGPAEEATAASREEDFGVEYLLKRDEDRGEGGNDTAPALGPKKEITDIAATAESLQPKGYTLATTQVKTPIPYLLRGTLREYQHIGLDWLVTMYEKKLNGILADEMGLGKTIQTISLLAHLACEKGSWGPHLIIVPTSVMLNWEMEIKRWCPSFKILTYYGAQKERKLKRQGWTKPNAFHICITSYKLVLQDHQAFRRKNWKYLILDEAQNIKNFKSQRWQSLLNFNSQRRLLLTGTPLQNSLMELWSLMHFLMPHVFQSHREFKEWFSNPLTGMIEGSQEYNESLVKRLHKVLRPFLLRRVKVDVEKQMPKKYEHVIKCRLSKRQRYLYDDFMAQATTKETLATGHFMSVINILMQLRKVCNHPNLFDPRPIHSPFITEGICFSTASLVLCALNRDPFKHVDMGIFDLINLEGRVSRYEADTFLPKWKVTRKLIEEIAESPDPPPRPKPVKMKVNRMLQPVPKPENRTVVLVNSPRPVAPLQRPMTPVLPEALAPMHPMGPVLPGPVQPPLLPHPMAVPISLPLSLPPSPVPVPPTTRPQGPTLVPTLSQNNAAAAMLQAPVSAPQVLPTLMPAAQLVPNAPQPPVLPAPAAASSLKPGPVPAPAMRLAANPLSPGAVGSMMKPVTVHSTTNTLPGYNFPATSAVQQRLLLSPDMQARLPSGEVVSIAQLASLANRPLQSAPGSKPLTFQIQGNKLTLTGTQVRQVTMAQPRQLQRNVVHLVSAGGQHHIISQPAQVALIQAMTQQGGQAQGGVQAMSGPQPTTILPAPASATTAAATSAAISVPIATTQVPSSMVNSSGVVKIVVRQAPRDGLVPSPALQQPPRPATATSLPAALMAQRAQLPVAPMPPVRLPTQPLVPVRAPTPLQALVRPMIRVVQAPAPSMEQSSPAPAPPSPVTAAPLPIPPATTIAAAVCPALAPRPAAAPSPGPKEEPETLMLRSTTPTPPPPSPRAPRHRRQPPPPPRSPFYLESLEEKRKKQKEERLDRLFRLNEQHCNLAPIYGTEVLRLCTLFPPGPPREQEEEGQEVAPELDGWKGPSYSHCYMAQMHRDPQHLEAYWQQATAIAQAILTPQQRVEQLADIIERFIFAMPPVEAPAITIHTSHPPPSLLLHQAIFKETLRREISPRASGLHRIVCNMRTQFPDLRLIQYDCGKLQTLDLLLRQLKAGAHRVLIFTQMTRMLDVLEQFLNYHGHIYLRLDGSTRVEQRQALMERFNADKRIFCFILSTRSGGVGVNLTGADTVVFYDSDWNPTMDAQAQDRCHRIGQTRDVHIYRLISERTVEENILKKANQKRMLGDMAIEGGNFTTAYFKQQTIRELFEMPLDEPAKKEGEVLTMAQEDEEDPMANKQTQILEQALCKAEDPEDIRAATQAKAEQVAELAEFNENIPLDADERPSKEEEEEMSKAEQEIASLMEQLTPIERYAMNFLEASLEDISREELKQAEEQVEAARKDIDQAKDEVVFKLPDDEDEGRLSEEGYIKKSKKAKVPSRAGPERTGTRMSERLRGTRLSLREADGVDTESPQARLPSLRHLRGHHARLEAEEAEDHLSLVAQHTRGAAIRRDLVREETPAPTRKAAAKREESGTKVPGAGERVLRPIPHRTEAPIIGERVLRTSPQRPESPATGDKVLRGTPQRAEPPATIERVLRAIPQRADIPVDRMLRGAPQRAEPLATMERVLRSAPLRTDASAPGDRVPRLAPLRPEAPPAGEQDLRPEAPVTGAKLLQPRPEVAPAEEETPQPTLPATETGMVLGAPALLGHEITAPTGELASKKPPVEHMLRVEPPPTWEKVLGSVELSTRVKMGSVEPSSASEKVPLPAPCSLEIPASHKLVPSPETPASGEEPPEEAKGSLGKAEVAGELAQGSVELDSVDVKRGGPVRRALEEPESLAPDGPAAELSPEMPAHCAARTGVELPAAEPFSTTEGKGPGELEPQPAWPLSGSLNQPVEAANSLPRLKTLPPSKEHNGVEGPSPLSNSLPEPQPRELAQGATEPLDMATGCSSSLKEVSKRGLGDQEDKPKHPDGVSAANPASLGLGEMQPGTTSSSDSPSPAKTPRRRTSADVEIRQNHQGQDGPAAKVLRKLPGRLVTVVEEKELIRRRRNRIHKLDTTGSTVVSPSSSSAHSISELELSPSSKDLPLLRDLPARRRIELESRATKERGDEGSGLELPPSLPPPPLKRKRGRPPKNKSPEQPSQGEAQPPPSTHVPRVRKPEIKTPEPSSPKTLKQPCKGETRPPPGTLKPRAQKLKPKAPEPASPRSKTESSENDSPLEKRRRGRPPKAHWAPATPSTESPPKRKRGRPPKNPASPRVETAAPRPGSTSDRDTSAEKELPPPGRKRRWRRKEEPSQAPSESSSDGEEARPLTRLARLRQEEKLESGSECSALLPSQGAAPKPEPDGTSSGESSTSEQTPARSTRQRPGSLVPPLEQEHQRRKRGCLSEGGKSPGAAGSSEDDGGGESESSAELSGEEGERQPKRRRRHAGRATGSRRRQCPRGSSADRILRSAAATPAGNTRSATSTTLGGVAGAPTPSATAAPAAMVTSSLSIRGRKPKT